MTDLSGDSHSDSQPSSITRWFNGLKTGDAESVRQLWDRYSHDLIAAARNKLGSTPRQAADEEDVAISVFTALCRGAEAGRFDDIRDRDDLWWLLLKLTHRKSVSQIRHELADKRGGGKPKLSISQGDGSDSAPFGFRELISDEPTPQYLLILQEEHARLLGLLRNDQIRQIAVLRLEGYTVREVAEKLKIGLRAVERKLKLIRETWEQAQDDPS